MAKEIIRVQSNWTKGNERCTVYTKRNPQERFSTIKFGGYNPFPCFEMKSTFGAVRDWLYANGWTPQKFAAPVYTVTMETPQDLVIENTTEIKQEKSEESTETLYVSMETGEVRTIKGWVKYFEEEKRSENYLSVFKWWHEMRDNNIIVSTEEADSMRKYCIDTVFSNIHIRYYFDDIESALEFGKEKAQFRTVFLHVQHDYDGLYDTVMEVTV